jgi:hypothetical protein
MILLLESGMLYMKKLRLLPTDIQQTNYLDTRSRNEEQVIAKLLHAAKWYDRD